MAEEFSLILEILSRLCLTSIINCFEVYSTWLGLVDIFML